MLVLSRQENQKVLFPHLGITVEVCGLKGNKVKLGVDAPPEIRVLRAELFDEQDQGKEFDFANTFGKSDASVSAEERHQKNNRLNSAALQIQIAQKLLDRGSYDKAIAALEGSLEKLRELDGQVGRSKEERSSPPSAKWKALLVEDDANERELMGTILSMCGFDVHMVENGMEAIHYLKSNKRPDCVLMDMQMPKLSGPETIATIRNELECTDIPIYGVSGLQRHEAQVPMGDRGVSGWFSKPVDAKKLLSRIIEDFKSDAPQSAATLN